jgi:hypothetical protein
MNADLNALHCSGLIRIHLRKPASKFFFFITRRLSAVLVLYLAAGGPAAGQSIDPRVEALLRQMTWDEKLSLVHGTRDPRELGTYKHFYSGRERAKLGKLGK